MEILKENLKDISEKVALSPFCTNPEHKRNIYVPICDNK